MRIIGTPTSWGVVRMLDLPEGQSAHHSTQLICTNDSMVHLSSSLTMALFLVRKALNWDQHPDFHSPQTSRIKATTPFTFPFKKKKPLSKKIKTWHIQRAIKNSVTKESNVFKSSSLTDVTCNLLTVNWSVKRLHWSTLLSLCLSIQARLENSWDVLTLHLRKFGGIFVF